MPLLDSFTVDHTRMQAPAVRLAKSMQTPNGDNIHVYDLRFTKPNKTMLSARGIHTLEHLFAFFMRQHMPNTAIIDISPMGCRTGFYMSIIGDIDEAAIIDAWIASMHNVLQIESEEHIPELNEYQCGSYKMHSLVDAQHAAQTILDEGITVNDNTELQLDPDFLRSLGNTV